MEAETNERPGGKLVDLPYRGVARTASWFVLATGLLGLTGFVFNAPSVAGGVLDSIPMSPTAALCFVLLSGALLLWQGRHPWGVRALRASAAAVLLIATGVLIKLMLSPGQTGGIPLWQMSPFTAGLFILSSGGQFRLARLKPGPDAASTAASGALLAASSLILLGYLYHSPFFYGGIFIPVAFGTGLAFLAFGIALAASDPESLSATPFFDNSLKAALLRNFLPLIIAVILLNGFVDSVVIDLASHPVVNALVVFIALTAAVWLTSRISGRLDYRAVQAQRELAESERRYRSLFEQARDAILLLETPEEGELIIRDANSAALRIHGYTREEMLGKPISFLDAEVSPDQVRERGERAKGAGGALFEVRHQRKDGSVLDLEVSLRRWEVGGKRYLLDISRDITERKQAEKERERMRAQLQQSQKMESVGRLASGVAHDFNNLLTAIICYSGFLMKNLAVNDPRREDAGEILAAADRAAVLVGQLLAFSRKQLLSPKVVDLNASVGGMVQMLTRLIGENIKLETRLAARSCQVKVDPGQIDQLIVNLVVNARDAMPGGGVLVLETALVDREEDFFDKHPELRRGPLVCLSIADTGLGMSEDVKTHLFEPFFTTKEKGKGTGLGLATVFGIIKQSGGEIEVESEPGRGTTFRIYLPHVEENGNGGADGQGGGVVKDKLPGGTETILLVEDEESLRRVGERILQSCGYTVIAAASGKEAVEAAAGLDKPADLLLTDVLMPDMNGQELAKELARRKLVKRTLYMSGYTDDAIAKHGVLEPGIAFIYKPFTAAALTAKLREVLEGPADQAKA